MPVVRKLTLRIAAGPPQSFQFATGLFPCPVKSSKTPPPCRKQASLVSIQSMSAVSLMAWQYDTHTLFYLIFILEHFTQTKLLDFLQRFVLSRDWNAVREDTSVKKSSAVLRLVSVMDFFIHNTLLSINSPPAVQMAVVIQHNIVEILYVALNHSSFDL